VVPEPVGGAHRSRAEAIAAVGDALEAALAELRGGDGGTLRNQRREKFLEMGKKGLG
jgi:acetyl-CoA carboxylase carboxyl transferase subunit alpha